MRRGFGIERSTSNTTPLSLAPSIQVPSYVTLGGSTQGVYSDISGNYEFQNYLSMGFGRHALKFGVRLRDTRESSSLLSNPTEHSRSNPGDSGRPSRSRIPGCGAGR